MSNSAVDYQTKSANVQITDMNANAQTSQSRVRYQMEMYGSLQYFNQLLITVYILLFVAIHLFILYQYLTGVRRNTVSDSIWLIALLLYPYLVGYVERAIYDSIGFAMALFYGQTYVSNFDKLLVGTDFYKV